MSQADLANAMGGGRPAGSVAAIEQGRRKTGVNGKTLAALDRALRWAPGSARTVLDGGNPIELRAVPEGVTVIDAEPGMRVLLDELTLTSPEDRARTIATLVAVARSLRDQELP